MVAYTRVETSVDERVFEQTWLRSYSCRSFFFRVEAVAVASYINDVERIRESGDMMHFPCDGRPHF